MTTGGDVPDGDSRLAERLPLTPDAVLFFSGGLFAITGVVATTSGDHEPLSAFLFQAFMNVGLAVGVLAGTVYLRRSELPRSTWWNVVSGYLAGIVFIAVLLLWAALPELRDGVSLLALREQFVFFGNLGGLFGFAAGISRARTEYNRELRRELEARQRALERQNERLEEFAGIVSHDLRNPLSVAQGHLQLLRDGVDDEAREDLQRLGDALDRMDALIDDLLELARAGERLDELDPVALERFVRSCWATVDTSEATLVTDVDGSVWADESRLAQLFENLFRNAIEHGSTGPHSQAHEDAVEHGATRSRPEADGAGEGTGPGSTITVGELDDGSGFYVADDGPGIPPDEREDVFEAGYSTTPEGTGFGLGIVAEVVDAHGWSVTVTESEDGGARFEISGVEWVE